MEFKVLYTRGDGIYIVQKGEDYYLISLEVAGEPVKSKFIDSFLKFGYFTPVDSMDESEMRKIKNMLK